MADIVFSREFIAEWEAIKSPRVSKHVDAMLQTIEKMPRFGSPMVSDSVRRQYGPDVRKALVLPFEIIHEYDQDTDTAYVYTLLYAPAVT